MKTMARDDCRQEITDRLRRLHPGIQRRWGRMTVHQMVCHLIDSHGMMTGDKAVSDASGPLQRTALKWLALYVPLQWRPNIRTRPEIDQHVSGTAPTNFAEDLASLLALVETTGTTGSAGYPAHPIFGRMSHAAWMRWNYLHIDHHLRQFGV
jgi:uncharacterized protein DUF1569